MTEPIVYSTSMSKKYERAVLLHPTSLPSKYGIGSLGKKAFQCIEQLDKTGIRLWQILPSVRQDTATRPMRPLLLCRKWLIDLEELMIDGYLGMKISGAFPVFDRDRIDYQAVRAYKEPLLAKAAQSFLNTPTSLNVRSTSVSARNMHHGWMTMPCTAYFALCITIPDGLRSGRRSSVFASLKPSLQLGNGMPPRLKR